MHDTNFLISFDLYKVFFYKLQVIIIFQFCIETNEVNEENYNLTLRLIIPAMLWFSFREIVQLVNNPYNFVSSIFNWVDVVQLVVVPLTLSNIIDDRTLSSYSEKIILLIATFTVWMRLLFIIGNLIFPVAVFNVALIQV